MSEEPPKERILSTNEVPKYLADKFGKPAMVSVATLRCMVTIGGGPERVRVGGKVGYLPSAIDRWHKQRCEKVMPKELQPKA